MKSKDLFLIVAAVAAFLFMIVSMSGCETIVRNFVAPAVQEFIEEKTGKKGDEPPGGGHGRGGSKDSTKTPRDSTRGKP